MNRLRLNLDKKTEIWLLSGDILLACSRKGYVSTEREDHNLDVLQGLALSMEKQILFVARSASFNLRQNLYLRLYLDRKSLIALVHTLVILRIGYWNPLYLRLALKAVQKLQRTKCVGQADLRNFKIQSCFLGPSSHASAASLLLCQIEGNYVC